MNILALDCALIVGFASFIDGHIESGVYKLKQRSDESPGMRYHRFWKLLGELAEPGVIDVTYYEKPGGLQGSAREQHDGYITRIIEYCTLNNIDYRPVSAPTIKKHVTGRGNASKSDVMKWFEGKVGRPPVDDNEADAVALLFFACDEVGIDINDVLK